MLRFKFKQSGAQALEKSLMRPFLYFREIRATDLAVSQLLGSTIAIISANVPGQRMWASVARAQVQVLQNSGSWMVTDEIQEKKYIECSSIKSARVSALTGFVPFKMA